MSSTEERALDKEILRLKGVVEQKEKEIQRLQSAFNNLIADAVVGHDPIKDEDKKYSILEWMLEVQHELGIFSRMMLEAGRNPCNEAQKVTERTFREWMSSWRQWASW